MIGWHIAAYSLGSLLGTLLFLGCVRERKNERNAQRYVARVIRRESWLSDQSGEH